jgi:predicted HAD superfamily phosphohydrolase
LPKFAEICEKFQKFAQSCQHLRKVAEICIKLPKFADICEKLQIFAQRCIATLRNYWQPFVIFGNFTQFCQFYATSRKFPRDMGPEKY